MAEFWTSINRGSDLYPGTYEQPFKSIQRLVDALDAGGNYTYGYIEEGHYKEGCIDGDGLYYCAMIGVGNVIIDSGGFGSFMHAFTNSDWSCIANITFKNNTKTLFEYSSGTDRVIIKDCTFMQDSSYYESGIPINYGNIINSGGSFYLNNCTFYGYGSGSLRLQGCYLNNCVIDPNMTNMGYGVYENCAGADSDIYNSPGGINAATYAPPFTDISTPSNPDLTYDSGHANYGIYVNTTPGGRTIGRPRSSNNSTHWYIDTFINGNNATTGQSMYGKKQDGSESPGNEGAWDNYEGYFDKSWKDIVITSGSNDSFQFDEGAGAITATIASGTYYDGTSFASAISDAISASSAADAHTIVFGANLRIEWSTSGASLTINCNTYTTNSAWTEMGFDTSSDKSGSSLYYAEYPLCNGAVGTAESDAGPGYINTAGVATIDTSILPSATNADVVSPVKKYYVPKRIKSIFVDRTVLNNGEVDSTPGDADRTIMVRANNSDFNMQDPDGTTALDWTHVKIDMSDLTSIITGKYRYWQFRIRMRNNAV